MLSDRYKLTLMRVFALRFIMCFIFLIAWIRVFACFIARGRRMHRIHPLLFVVLTIEI